jgi:hypothetical protein
MQSFNRISSAFDQLVFILKKFILLYLLLIEVKDLRGMFAFRVIKDTGKVGVFRMVRRTRTKLKRLTVKLHLQPFYFIPNLLLLNSVSH